jgi:hypothetical protein
MRTEFCTEHPLEKSAMTSDELKIKKYARLVKTMLTEPNVTLGHGKKGFGDDALNINGRIFAMLTSKKQYVVKLPKHRVLQLVASGEGSYLEMANRQMKEWFIVSEKSTISWLKLAREAHGFVSSNA